MEQSKGAASSADLVKYVSAAALVVAGVFAFYWFQSQLATSVRSLIVAVGIVGAIAVFLTTSKGQQAREFFSETRFELRKVVWPTREETVRLTWVVLIAVAVISLFIAGVDLLIDFLIRLVLKP